MMRRSTYVSTQMAIVVLPPIFAAYFASSTHQFPNPFDTFWAYACGLSGMIEFVVVKKLFDLGNEAICATLSLALVAAAFLTFVLLFKKEGKRNVVLIVLNSIVSLWSVLFGLYWQSAIRRRAYRTNYRIRRLRLSRLLLVQETRHPSPRIIRTLICEQHERSKPFNNHAACARSAICVALLSSFSPYGWAAAIVEGPSVGHAGHLSCVACPALFRRTHTSRAAMVARRWRGFWFFARLIRPEQDTLRTYSKGSILHATCASGRRTLVAVRRAYRLSSFRGLCK